VELKIKQTQVWDPNRREMEEINGIKCSTSVKYLGVRVAVDKKDQTRISKEQINKNV